MVVRLKLEELRRGLVVVFACSLCLLASLIACFALVSRAVLTVMLDLTGLVIMLSLGALVVYVGVYALLVVVDAAFALMNLKHFARRGLEACA